MGQVTMTDGVTTITVDPEFDFDVTGENVESKVSTRNGDEYIYKFGSFERISFSLQYVTQAVRNTINNWWKERTEIYIGVPYGLDVASAVHRSLYIGSQNSFPNGMQVSDDGTKLYFMGGNKFVYQYTLSTAWDIGTATYDTSYDASATLTTIGGSDLAFGDSGSKMYIPTGSPDGVIYQFTLSTPWDVSTASYASKSYDPTTQEGSPQAIYLKSDGTAFYLLGAFQDTVFEYSLSTAWDISTASYTSDSVQVRPLGVANTPVGLAFNPDGTRFMVVDQGTNTVYQYSLSTAWDLSTATYDEMLFDFSSYTTSGGLFRGVAFDTNGYRMYVCETGNDTILQVSLAYNVRLSNRKLPISKFIKPYRNLYEGKVEGRSF